LTRYLCTALLAAVFSGGLNAAEELTVGSFQVEAELLYHEDFSSDLKKWKSEGRGKIWVEEGRLHMDAWKVEMTAWCPFEMAGNLLITYEAFVKKPSDANNINVFFLATAAEGKDILKLDLSGAYKEYHQLPNYIMTFTSGYTRLRRNPGFNLVSENTQVKALPVTEYQLAILIQGSEVRCFINDIPVHAYRDESRLQQGKIAFRSWHTRLWWDNLKIYQVMER
jgi:hypothetical protein